MTKLYEISNSYRAQFDRMQDQDEWSSGDLLEIEKLATSFEEKAIAVAAYIKELEGEVLLVEGAIYDMRHRLNQARNRVEFLKNYLLHNMSLVDKQEIVSSPYFKIKIRKNPEAVHISNESSIPDQYFDEVIERHPNKKLIKEHLKNGVVIEGAFLQASSRLEIK